ncbi:MAG: NAD-binding protein [Candidatus Nanoarchaeia archaeon]|nr:NAD-binding protein [Candidatus Nanoarchaeia archaeon]
MPPRFFFNIVSERSIKKDFVVIGLVFLALIAVLFFGGTVVSFIKGAPLSEAVSDVTKRILLNQNIDVTTSSVFEGFAYLAIVFVSVGIMYYLASTFFMAITKIKFRSIVHYTRMKTLKNHVIVCGLGRVGRNAIESLKLMHVKCIGIDYNDRVLKNLEDLKFLVMDGDSLDERILIKAGVLKAKSLIASLGEDQDNIFLVMAAKHLNPKIRVVARCNDKRIAQKMLFAGADEVILPEVVGGQELAKHSLIVDKVNEESKQEKPKTKK